MKPIPEFPEYQMDHTGRIWSNKTNKYLSPWVNNKGRVMINLSINNKLKGFLIHRLVARAYGLLPCLYSEMDIDHIDRNPLNNNLDNLQVLPYDEHLEKTLLDRGHKARDTCTECNKVTTSKTGICKNCSPLVKQEHISKEDIVYWVTNHSWVRAGKELGLTDNGLRKRYKYLTGKDPKALKKIKNT